VGFFHPTIITDRTIVCRGSERTKTKTPHKELHTTATNATTNNIKQDLINKNSNNSKQQHQNDEIA
jgi:hypothetical protein